MAEQNSDSIAKLPPVPDDNKNRQPKGKYCSDCARYDHPSCPYPGSNVTMDMCNAFYAMQARGQS